MTLPILIVTKPNDPTDPYCNKT